MTVVAPPLSSRYFECGIPDAKLKIQLNQDVIGRLGAAVMGSFTTMRRRGLEVGGLLLGHAEADCVVVEDFEELPSEHQHGPSWLLSENDRRFLEAAVARANGGVHGRRVVGLYRSQTRTGFTVAEEDAALMKQYCPAANRVFLLIKPEAAGASVGMFAAGDGLRATSEVFPFRRRSPVAGPESTPMFQSPPPAMESAAAPAMPPAEASRLRTRIGLGLAILVLAFAGGYTGAKWWTSSPKTDNVTAAYMTLRTVWDGSSLDLRWDRNSAPIRLATAGILWIHDGGQSRRVDVTKDDLTKGSIQYWPLSRDLVFHLDVFTPEKTATGWVRTVGLPLPERAPVVEPRPNPPAAASTRARPAPPSRRRQSASRNTRR
jgi:hypothetical protein